MLPGWGGMAVFDRSWYGRVLVERVEGFATREQWLRAYDEINGFERTLADEGMVLVKLWLHISDEEQLKRFERRQKDPLKSVEADRRGLAQPRQARRLRGGGRGHARPHRPARCPVAPDRGRLEALRPREVMETVIERIEAGMGQWGMEPPPPLGRAADD